MTVVLSIIALFVSIGALIMSAASFVLMLRRVQPVAEPQKNHGSRHRLETTAINLDELRAAQEESATKPVNVFDAAREVLRRPSQTKRSSYRAHDDPDFPYAHD